MAIVKAVLKRVEDYGIEEAASYLERHGVPNAHDHILNCGAAWAEGDEWREKMAQAGRVVEKPMDLYQYTFAAIEQNPMSVADLKKSYLARFANINMLFHASVSLGVLPYIRIEDEDADADAPLALVLCLLCLSDYQPFPATLCDACHPVAHELNIVQYPDD